MGWSRCLSSTERTPFDELGLQSEGPRTPQQPDRQHDDAAYQAEHTIHGHADDAERDQQHPHQRVDDHGQ